MNITLYKYSSIKISHTSTIHRKKNSLPVKSCPIKIIYIEKYFFSPNILVDYCSNSCLNYTLPTSILNLLEYRKTQNSSSNLIWILHIGAHNVIFRQSTKTGKCHQRFCRWRDGKIRDEILARLMDMADFEWLLIDSGCRKVPPHAARAR